MIKSFSCFSILMLIYFQHSQAQISGCTDPLAANYNSSAINNDGSCVYDPASVAPITSLLLDDSLAETSGLIKWDGYIWAHNDNTDTNIYSLDTATGVIIQSYPLSNVVNNDWEEISQDSNFVYLGDFGNNVNGNRTDLHILRIEKNSLLNNTPDIDTIWFSYSDQTDFTPTGSNNTDFDCEAFIVSDDSIYLFTKQWVSNATGVYALPKTPGSYTADLKTIFDVNGLITGATYLESKKSIALCGYSNLLSPFIYLLYDFSGSDFFSGNKRKISVSLGFHQVEGITTENGLTYWISNEHFVQPPFVDNPQKLHVLDLESFLGDYFNSLINDVLDIESEYEFEVYPNPANQWAVVSYQSIEEESIVLKVFDLLGEEIYSCSFTANCILPTADWTSGFYILQAGKNYRQLLGVIKR